jgi:hypothetical protein
MIKVKSEKIYGTYFFPDHIVDEAGEALDRHLPTAGNELALHPKRHEAEDQRQRDQHPQRAVGEADVIVADVQRNERFHRELVHRVDFAFGRHACLLPLLFSRGRPGPGKSHDVPHADAEPEEQHQHEEQGEGPVAKQLGQFVHTPADHRAGERRTNQLPEELLP